MGNTDSREYVGDDKTIRKTKQDEERGGLKSDFKQGSQGRSLC